MTTSYICYHLVFCPRYRRRIFDVPGVKNRFLELAKLKCDELDIVIQEAKFGSDYIYLIMNCPPNIAASDVASMIKTETSAKLREEFTKLQAMPNMWTRNYLASTEETLPEDVILNFVNSQKTRP